MFSRIQTTVLGFAAMAHSQALSAQGSLGVVNKVDGTASIIDVKTGVTTTVRRKKSAKECRDFPDY